MLKKMDLFIKYFGEYKFWTMSFEFIFSVEPYWVWWDTLLLLSFYIFKHEQKIDDQSICTLGDIDRKDFLILDSFVPYIPINLYIVPHFKGQSYFNKLL